ncbi:hypothetical protein K8I31_20360, partial [bacterium]|nr:hypothetical protein [bacterium]
MRYLIFFFAAFLTILSSNAQESEYPITECKSVQDVQAARQRGAVLIRTGERYFVRIGSDYKGPYASLETAVGLRRDYEKRAKDAGVILPSATAPTEENMAYFDPVTMMFPFIEARPKQGAFMLTPDGKYTPAPSVMIHPEPLLFDEIVFGSLDLTPPQLRPKMVPGAPGRPAVAPTLPPNQRKLFFAVTGRVAAKSNVQLPTDALTFSVGAAVVAGDGTVIWKQYGAVDETMNFRIVTPMPQTARVPQYLMLFTVAKG